VRRDFRHINWPLPTLLCFFIVPEAATAGYCLSDNFYGQDSPLPTLINCSAVAISLIQRLNAEFIRIICSLGDDVADRTLNWMGARQN
jgi:hypothetical protein